jgi:hypothetical protein
VFRPIPQSAVPSPSKGCSIRKAWGSMSSLRWAGHVARAGMKRNRNKILVRKLKEIDNFEDLGINEKDNITRSSGKN